MRRKVNASQQLSPKQTGSPGSEGEPVFVVIGRLGRPHGVQGKVVMEPYSSFAGELSPGQTIFIGDQKEAHTITSVGWHQQSMLLGLEGITNRDEVGRFRNMVAGVEMAALPELPEGEYYHHQLIGLAVIDETGKLLGSLNEILETGANDVYVVHGAEGGGVEILLPAIKDVILEVNLERREMRVRPPEWA